MKTFEQWVENVDGTRKRRLGHDPKSHWYAQHRSNRFAHRFGVSHQNRVWERPLDAYHIAIVQEMPNSQWAGLISLKNRVPYKQELFDNVEDALKFVGYPVGTMPIPKELQ